MIDLLPSLNATLNATATILLLIGWRLVRTGRVEAHKKVMTAAVVVSALFLVSYLTYHSLGEEKRFAEQGILRIVYFIILATHIPLAGLMVPPILALLWFGYHDQIDRHRKLARITLPIWLYVSVTGVLIYLFLYLLWPPA
ncbi:MAG: DUF420 domain-containing protein [Planctomycetes bacterium]|nr:DUF420 domain-containing protein [Planctomycetota bacterium]